MVHYLMMTNFTVEHVDANDTVTDHEQNCPKEQGPLFINSWHPNLNKRPVKNNIHDESQDTVVVSQAM